MYTLPTTKWKTKRRLPCILNHIYTIPAYKNYKYVIILREQGTFWLGNNRHEIFLTCTIFLHHWRNCHVQLKIHVHVVHGQFCFASHIFNY